MGFFSSLGYDLKCRRKKTYDRQGQLITVSATQSLDAVKGKRTAECFTGGRSYAFRFRHEDFDLLLDKDQPDSNACVVATCAIAPWMLHEGRPLMYGQRWTFMEAVRALPCVDEDIARLHHSLIECGYILTLPQVDRMIELAEYGERTVLFRSGEGLFLNKFFLVKTANKDEPVAVGQVFRYSDHIWQATLYSLDLQATWGAEDELIVCNLDASRF